ncbi:MAG TPA: hypothetical protein VFJ51_09025 [Nitrososphaeraceae archaeon]|nr:hypothetical protein [Nitrososphaeraceae archaeon]
MSRLAKKINVVHISSIIITVLLTFSILCLASINMAHAQIPPNLILPPHSTPSSPPPHSTQSSPPSPAAKLHAVKITSPTRGQQVLISKNLTVSGVSTTSGNPATSHCQVSVIVNNIKPYQQAKGTGTRGAADFSKWNFVLTSKYTTIKQGPSNKITAKNVCSNDPKASYYSVNVTGVSAIPTAPRTISSGPSPTTQPGARIPVEQSKPVLPNNAANIGNTVGIRHPPGEGIHTSNPIPAGESSSDKTKVSDKTSGGSHHISKSLPSETRTLDKKMTELKNRIAKNLEEQLRRSGY